jgi:hypothetical protein
MKSILYLLLFGIAFYGCSKEKIETIEIDPAEAILGKWEAIKIGNWPFLLPIPEASGYVEYLPDSVKISYDYETDSYTYSKYSIDTILIVYTVFPNGFLMIDQYYYQFLNDNNEVRLDFKDRHAIFNTFIYKRLE